MPSHGMYLNDGLYRCENKECPNYREASDGTEDFPMFFMFTGGSYVPDPDTNEPEFQEGICPGCGTEAVRIDAETLEAV